jgi:hypothetical protein
MSAEQDEPLNNQLVERPMQVYREVRDSVVQFGRDEAAYVSCRAF